MISSRNDFTLPVTFRIRDGRRISFAAGAIFLLAWIVYGNSFDGVFQFDDTGNIVGNPNIEMKSFGWSEIQKTFYGIPGVHRGITRPVAYFSFALNHYFGALDVFGYHLVNFIVHVTTGFFFFLWIRRVLRLPVLSGRYADASYSIALFAAAFWVIHPIQVTAVTYIVQRMASMAAMFYVMAFYFYLRGRTSHGTPARIGWFAGCAMASVLAFATKENTLVLPVALFIFDLLLIQGIRKQTGISALKWVVFPMTAAALIGLSYQGPADFFSGYRFRSFTPLERLLTEHRILWQYIWWMVYPTSDKLSLFHDIELSTSLMEPWTTLPAVLSVYGAIGLAMFMSRKRPLISFLIAFFFVNHAVESTIVPLELIFEHRNYLPSMAVTAILAISIVYFLHCFRGSKMVQALTALAGVMILTANGHTTFYRNHLFKSEEALLVDNLTKTPFLSAVYNNLGTCFSERGRHAQATEAYRMAVDLETSPAKTMDRRKYYGNLAMNYVVRGEFEKAIVTVEKGSSESPTGPDKKLLWGLALAYGETGQTQRAIACIEKARQRDPSDRDIILTHALLLLRTGEINRSRDEAINLLEKYPAWTDGLGLLAEISMLENNKQIAIHLWSQVQKREPARIEAIVALCELYWGTGDREKAWQQMRMLWVSSPGRRPSETVQDIIRYPLGIHRPEWDRLQPIFKTILDEAM